MVKQPTISINLLYLIRGIAVALLILFFLPWIPATPTTDSINGASFVVSLLHTLNGVDVSDTRYFLMLGIIGLGFIPIGTLLILILSYVRPFHLSFLCILTGVIGITPFIFMVQPPNDVRKWYFPMILTPLCLLALIVIGAVLHWKRTITTDNPVLKTGD